MLGVVFLWCFCNEVNYKNFLAITADKRNILVIDTTDTSTLDVTTKNIPII